MRVTLYPSGKTYHIHKLVADAFLKKGFDHTQVNHIDGVKINNNVENLEWCTGSENIKHAISMGLINTQAKSGCDNFMANYTEDDIDKIWCMYNAGHTIREIATYYGEPKGKRIYEQIRRIIRGEHYKR